MTAKKITEGSETGRGRPRAFDPEAAVETALGLFHARGYDAVGVAELSRAIGVKPPSLYAAFGSKQGLYERAVVLFLSREGAFVPETLSETGPVAEIGARLFARAAEAYSADRGHLGCLVTDGTRNSADAGVCAFTESLRAQARDRIIARFRQDFPPESAPGKAERLADFVVVTLAGLSASARDGLPPEALAEAAAIAGAGFRAACAEAPKTGA
ncbi:TetR/AcrR family transcriptional regulator [Pelagibius sp.]|uniref:TetR/AcrR family transcriptional regulator n=1 Tax=Pelagibius sp. TaxID=1931238 RepID=UPI002633E639|nr:TetR/AcrR family transcriptional regulator [Pelagibius sp.]